VHVCAKGGIIIGTGVAFTTAFVVVVSLHPFSVAITEYVPVAQIVALLIVLFPLVLVNPFGPTQTIAAPAGVGLLFTSNVFPSHTGPVLVAVTVGVVLSVTIVAGVV
jgi:hypothetical protein